MGQDSISQAFADRTVWIAAAADPADPADGTSKDYLLRFASMAGDQSGLPPDKLSRWLGYIDGVLAARGRWASAGFPSLQARTDARDGPVDRAHRQVLAGLADAVGRSSAVPELSAFYRDLMGTEGHSLGHGVGYVQGVLTAERLLSVAEERDRTRPIFHAAYREAGIEVPASREVSR